MTQPSKASKDAWLARNLHKRPTINKSWKLRRKYGITFADYEQLYKEQAGACAICGCYFNELKATMPHVDHDHGSNWVRGLLCNNCNTGLGFFGEDIARLLSAVEYLIVNCTPTEFVFTRRAI